MNKYLFILSLLFSGQSLACKCKTKTVEGYFADAKAVLLVEVESLNVVRADANSESPNSVQYLEASFHTIEPFKEADSPISFLTTRTNCGLALYPGQKYLVYVPKNSPVENAASRCDGSFHYQPQLEFSQAQLDAVRQYVNAAHAHDGT